MKTRLDETNKMRKLMGLSLLNEQLDTKDDVLQDEDMKWPKLGPNQYVITAASIVNVNTESSAKSVGLQLQNIEGDTPTDLKSTPKSDRNYPIDDKGTVRIHTYHGDRKFWNHSDKPGWDQSFLIRTKSGSGYTISIPIYDPNILQSTLDWGKSTFSWHMTMEQATQLVKNTQKDSGMYKLIVI